jgi:hypothetical protein
MQELSWSWVARIIWGVFWRWIIACLVIIFAVAVIFMAMSRTGQVGLLGQITFALWILALVPAIAATLRARHGRFRLMLVSAEGSATAFD